MKKKPWQETKKKKKETPGKNQEELLICTMYLICQVT